MTRRDELPPAVVAAITALLATLEEPADEPEREGVWSRSGKVAPSWAERDANAWRDRERERGWRA